jgi:hypothetical protein
VKITPIRLRQAGNRLEFDDRQEGFALRVGVHKLTVNSPNDVSALVRLIDAGEVKPSEIVALIRKTEGNGRANDFTCGFAALSYSLALAPSEWAAGAPKSRGRGQRFGVTQAMNTPVASAPMAMRPQLGRQTAAEQSCRRDSEPLRAFDRCRRLQDSLAGGADRHRERFHACRGYRRLAFPPPWRTSRCGSGWASGCLERPSDGRGVEFFGRFDITRIEFMPVEISVSHSFLRIAAVDRRQGTSEASHQRTAN